MGQASGDSRAAGLYPIGMVTVTCDRCDRRLEVPEEKRGTKVQCPYCGDVNVVPERDPDADPPPHAPHGARRDRASELGLPPDRGPERRVMKVRPAMFRARPALFTLLVAVLAGGVIGAAVFAWRGRAPYAYGAGAAALAALVWLDVWKLRTMFVALEITNKRTVETRGLLSRATSEVLHEDIKNLQITQTFWQRIWGVGTIGISSSGQDGIEIVVTNMPRPMEIKRTIDAYRDTLG